MTHVLDLLAGHFKELLHNFSVSAACVFIKSHNFVLNINIRAGQSRLLSATCFYQMKAK